MGYLIISIPLWASNPARAFEAGLGFSAVEEGDERFRPAAALHLGWSPTYYSRVYLWGREFGPVTEQTTLLSFSRRFGVFRSNTVTAGFGLALMDESVSIEYDGANADNFEKDEHNYNAGAAFGLAYNLKAEPLHIAVSWDAHVFPAGVTGGLLLASGRKNMLTLTMGTAL